MEDKQDGWRVRAERLLREEFRFSLEPSDGGTMAAVYRDGKYERPATPEECQLWFAAACARAQSIPAWQAQVFQDAKDKGWHTTDKPLSERIWVFLGNLMAEAAEAWEEARKPGFDPQRIYYSMSPGQDPKPEGLPIELADLVIRCLDTAEAYGIDLERAMSIKAEFNRKRAYRHGGKRA